MIRVKIIEREWRKTGVFRNQYHLAARRPAVRRAADVTVTWGERGTNHGGNFGGARFLGRHMRYMKVSNLELCFARRIAMTTVPMSELSSTFETVKSKKAVDIHKIPSSIQLLAEIRLVPVSFLLGY